jgi:hypothetical protein
MLALYEEDDMSENNGSKTWERCVAVLSAGHMAGSGGEGGSGAASSIVAVETGHCLGGKVRDNPAHLHTAHAK